MVWKKKNRKNTEKKKQVEQRNGITRYRLAAINDYSRTTRAVRLKI